MLITISSADIAEFHGSGVPAFARLYANKQFTTSEGIVIEQGSKSNPAFYQEFTCSLVGTAIRIASGSAYTTTDSLNAPDATYSLVIYSAAGRVLSTVFSRLRIPPDNDPTTWATLEIFSSGRFQKFPSTYLSSSAILALFNAIVNGAQKASDVLFGVLRLDVPADDLSNPIALGLNTPLLAPASDVVLGRTLLDPAPDDPLLPIAIGNNHQTFTALDRVVLLADRQTRYLDNYASLTAAMASLNDGNEYELKVTQLVFVGANVTIPPKILLSFEGNGRLAIQSGWTLTVGLMRDPGNYKVFTLADSTAHVRFSRGAVQKMNVAWMVGPTSGASITNALNDLLASCLANLGGTISIPDGNWLTTGNHSIPSLTTIEGGGNFIDQTGGGTYVKMTATGVPIFLIGPNVHEISVKNLSVDGDLKANVDGFYGIGSEPAGDNASGLRFENVTILQCVNGIKFESSAGQWLVRSVNLTNCIIAGCTFAGIYMETSNNVLVLNTTNIGVAAGAWAFYFQNVGHTNITGTEVYGIPGYIGTRQVMTNTVVAPAGITADGNGKSVIIGTQVAGSPLTVLVPLNTVDHTTDVLIAAAYRTALAANAEVDRLFKVGGAGANITLTYLVPAANDGTANFTIEDDTSAGISDDLSSTATTAGVARTGMAEGVCYIGGSHGAITFENCQDEGVKYFLVNDASDVSGITNIISTLVGSEILLNQTCVINSFGSNYLSRAFKGAGGDSRITSFADYVRTVDAYGNAFVPAELTAFTGLGPIVTAEIQTGDANDIVFRRPAKFLSPPISDGNPNTPVVSYGHYTGIGESKVLARFGRTTAKGVFDFYYDVFRDYATGVLKFVGNQVDPFKGYDFNASVFVPDFAYDAATWNGVLAVPTRNAIRDIIETLARIAPRITAVANSAAPTPNIDTTDQYTITALAEPAVFGAPTGTPTDGRTLMIRILDNGTARALTWNAAYRAVGITLPTTTTISKTLYVEFRYNSQAAKWDGIRTVVEA